MPLTQVKISDTDEVRRLARNVVEADWEDNQIEPYQARAFSRIKVITHRFADPAFDEEEHEYQAAVMAETSLAALYLLRHEISNVSELPAFQELLTDTKEMIKELAENTGVGAEAAASEEIELIPFADWGRNPEVPVPNKLNKSFTIGNTFYGVEGKTT